MKKSILVVMITLATTLGLDAAVRTTPAESFNVIMDTPLRNNTPRWQAAMDRNWRNWSESQKKDVLLRLYEEGALSEDDVVYWNMNQVPQINVGG